MKKQIITIAAAAVLAFAIAGCSGQSSNSGGASGGSASGGGTSEAAPAADTGGAAQSGGNDVARKATESGYLDKNGFVTVLGLIELNGKELGEVVESSSYKWDDEDAEWKRGGSLLSPMKGLSDEDHDGDYNIMDTSNYDFTADEVAALAMGAKGTPLEWYLQNWIVKYDSAEELLADQNVVPIDQCQIENGAYGAEIWALVQNSAGDRYIMEVRHYDSDDSGTIELYNEDFIAHNANGIASAFNHYYGLEDAHTIDAAWEILKSIAI